MNSELIKKALEYLDTLKELIDKTNYASLTDYVDLFDCTSTINKALLKAQELEKENEELLQAVSILKQKLEDVNNFKVAMSMLKQVDINIRLERVLGIIKKKNVDINGLKKCIELDLPLTDEQRLHKYNHDYVMVGMEELTQEEYELLVRYLYCE